MFGEINRGAIKIFSYAVRKFLKNSYNQFLVEKQFLDITKNHVKSVNGPIIFIPTHKSYLDFILVSYMSNYFKNKIPFIAAADDMAKIALVNL